MTKVEREYVLTGELTEALLEQIERVHTVYGIYHVKLSPSMDGLTVQYDASRLNPREVNDVLARAGLPVKPKAEA